MIRIGTYIVFDNQIKAGNEYFNTLIDRDIPILCAQPQMGKTGVLIYVASKILEYCKYNNIKKFRINHILHDANNDVRDQTKADYESAFGNGYAGFTPHSLFNTKNPILNIIHRPNLASQQKSIDKDTVYFNLYDESHIAIVRDGQLDDWDLALKEGGIDFHTGHCSATPFVYNLLSNPPHVPIVLEPSDKYFGIQQYFDQKRIRPLTTPFFEKSENERRLSATAVYTIIPDIVNRVNNDGPGYVPLRDRLLSEEDAESLQDYFMLKYNMKCIVEFYNNKEENMKEIQLRLKSPLSRDEADIVFVVLKGALRVGKRISKDHIRCIIDSPRAQSGATVVQSLLGRVCGNDINNFNFNIYCDIKEINQYITWWNDLVNGNNPIAIPSSPYNYSNDSGMRRQYHVTPPGTFPKRPDENKIRDYMVKNNLPFIVDGKNILPKCWVRVTETNKPVKSLNRSNEHSNNMARAVATGISVSTKTDTKNGDLVIAGVHLDGPSPYYQEDWNKVMNKGYKPGEVVLFFYLGMNNKLLPANQDLITDKCFFKGKE